MDEAFRSLVDDHCDRHPEGWGHDEFTEFLGVVAGHGYTLSPDQVGAALERRRLDRVLVALDLKGLGPARREAIIDLAPSLWLARKLTPDDLLQERAFRRQGKLAHSVLDALTSVAHA